MGKHTTPATISQQLSAAGGLIDPISAVTPASTVSLSVLRPELDEGGLRTKSDCYGQAT
jgi:hypothetical protein